MAQDLDRTGKNIPTTPNISLWSLTAGDVKTHFPVMSDWRVVSTSGEDVSVGTPEVKLAMDIASITIPLVRVERGLQVESVVLPGVGYGFSAGVGISVPFLNYNASSPDDVGFGSRVVISPFGRRPMRAKDFEGICYVMSVQDAAAAQVASASVLLFADHASLRSISPTSINAGAYVEGLGRGTEIVAGGAGVLAYNIRLMA